jgi:hypothetical protein
MMNWGIDFSRELKKMREEMDHIWNTLFEGKRSVGHKSVENSSKLEQTRKKKNPNFRRPKEFQH